MTLSSNLSMKYSSGVGRISTLNNLSPSVSRLQINTSSSTLQSLRSGRSWRQRTPRLSPAPTSQTLTLLCKTGIPSCNYLTPLRLSPLQRVWVTILATIESHITHACVCVCVRNGQGSLIADSDQKMQQCLSCTLLDVVLGFVLLKMLQTCCSYERGSD